MGKLEERRQQALYRNAALLSERRNYDRKMMEMDEKMKEAALRQMKMQEDAYKDSQKAKTSGWGKMALSGASIGASFSPVGAAIGAGVGAVAGVGMDMAQGNSLKDSVSHPFGEQGFQTQDAVQMAQVGAGAYKGYQANQRADQMQDLNKQYVQARLAQMQPPQQAPMPPMPNTQLTDTAATPGFPPGYGQYQLPQGPGLNLGTPQLSVEDEFNLNSGNYFNTYGR